MGDAIELVPLHDLQRNGDDWIATCDDSYFLVRPRSGLIH
jgi:hypothetical protein